ncbi:hypothetical protein OSB04_022640 [Centaurea solstitialis]|uniref:Cellulose synthase-like protein G3 n=1 Tax=Centaurea solstitialis TaxID=347529 RepID=A0AA38W7T7_9ASTR|nr:hypothetical protein OSB04_022640 [Centaurea solstitialis]
MLKPSLHTCKPSPSRFINQAFILIYTIAIFAHFYRHLLALIRSPSFATVSLFVSDLVLSFLWVTWQAFFLCPVRRKVFPANLAQAAAAAKKEYPGLDVFVLTADPVKEPALAVVNTALSVLAYDYPAEKLSVYVSDDGGSEVTLFAFMEAAKFAKDWLPYCRKYDLMDRSPEVYFGNDPFLFPETKYIQGMYEKMKQRIQDVAERGTVDLNEINDHDAINAFSRTPIKVLLKNKVDRDVNGDYMPNLIYFSREKNKDIPHHFKGGALNSLIRLSTILTNAPLFLAVDCDMYSNDPKTPLRALCYFLDPNVDPKLAFVQFPQRYHGINKNDTYGAEFLLETQVCPLGMDSWGGTLFMGTGGFFRRQALLEDATEPQRIWNEPVDESDDVMELAHRVASCSYEENTKWGRKIGFRYGSLVEDIFTGFQLHCLAWKSVSDPWFSLYAFLFLGAYGKEFLDYVMAGSGFRRWWNHQRTWLLMGCSSYPFSLFDWSLASLGMSICDFNVTDKASNDELTKRYEQGVFEFGVESTLLLMVGIVAVVNLIAFAVGMKQVLVKNGGFEELFIQLFIAGFGVVNSLPIYEGMVLRSDKGKMPTKIVLKSVFVALVRSWGPNRALREWYGIGMGKDGDTGRSCLVPIMSTATHLLHSSKPSSKTWLNRLFTPLYATAVSLLLLRHYRHLTRSPPTPTAAALFIADFVLAFMWFTSQSFHWNPIERQVFPENLAKVVSESEYPSLDVLICTADPTKEPPVGVVNTVLSVLAYDYPTDKVSVYVSDDGGSKATLYALMEGAEFGKTWIPYCKKRNIVDRSPEVYFGSDHAWFPETDEIKAMYESMKSRVEMVVQNDNFIHIDSEFQEAFRQWTPDFTRQNHPTVIQRKKGNRKVILQNHPTFRRKWEDNFREIKKGRVISDKSIDKDVAGGIMPNLIYVSREKNKSKPHNFKAGALNVLLRVSVTMSNSPIILVLDCDMYSNDPQTPLRALCYFMDPNADPRLGFVQFPQRFTGINENDIYASEFKYETQILSLGMDGLLGTQFMGTGAFLKRHVITGSVPISVSGQEVLKSAHQVASCNYEDNTKWGSKIGFRYGTLVEDTFTSFRLHCEGWKSVLCNPKRAAFLGGSPSNLKDSLTQIKRWYLGFLEIFFNKYSPITYGIWSMNPLQASCYIYYTLHAFWSIPTIVYAFLPQILLLNSIPIFTKVPEGGFFLYLFLFLGAYGKDFLDFVVFGGGTTQRWWNYQRMWLIWGLSGYPFALLEWSLKSLGISTFGFNVTSKAVIDKEESKRYQKGVFEFGAESVMFFPISVASVINLLSFAKGVMEVFVNGRLGEFLLQILVCGFGVVNSWPIYEGMFLRRDGGRMPLKITLASMVNLKTEFSFELIKRTWYLQINRVRVTTHTIFRLIRLSLTQPTEP